MIEQLEVRDHLPGELPSGWFEKLADTLRGSPGAWVRVPVAPRGQQPPKNTADVLAGLVGMRNGSIDHYWYSGALYFRLNLRGKKEAAA